MTREELRDYVDEQRSLNMIPYHVYSTLIDGIDTLEQEPILDKIRAKIEQLPTNYIEIQRPHSTVERDVVELGAVMRILDKYESESKNT